MSREKFIGREWELQKLREFSKRKTAGLVVCQGRRRIGKSTLIEHFSLHDCSKAKFIELYGLAPRENIDNKSQLEHFGELLGMCFGLPPFQLSNWNMAFDALASLTQKGRMIILLDEISWMAGQDRDFAGKLKGVWDTKLKKNNELLLFLCGSVTTWIEENILQDKGFMGRVSLTLTLEELSLCECNHFWNKNSLVSSYEKFKVLGVTGGVPRYLEEIEPHKNAEENIKALCFDREGVLFTEFDKIFHDIFGKRESEYRQIVQTLTNGHLEINEICEKLDISSSGAFIKKLNQLCLSGFLAHDYVWNLQGRKTQSSKYRLKDNYLRFYLKYIDPKRDLIGKGIYQELFLEEFSGWESMMGLQFENLVLNQLKQIIILLKIPPTSIISASPYFQKATARTKACQIDLLIHTKYTLYVCEIKFRRKISREVIDEVISKVQKLKVPDTMTVRPVLIYEGDLSDQVLRENFFSHTIKFDDLLENC
ncbi:MAG: ATPase [Verrucomicrobia bacterium]|nr:ATPase [Verrucomicrobiota bacterium]